MSDKIMVMKINIIGLFNAAMSQPTPGDRLIYLATAMPDAPAGVLLDFAEGKTTPIFADNAIVGHEEVKDD